MLNRLIAWSLQSRWLVLFCGVALLAVGSRALVDVPLEVFPELKAPTVTILTEAPGYAADEVETTVSFPMETAINGLPGLRRVRSSSTAGLSIVWAEFDFDADIFRSRQLVSERIGQVRGDLPEHVDQPEMAPVSSIAGEVMLLGLNSPDESVSPLEIRRVAEFDLRPRLLGITGVAQVTTIGGLLPEYQVDVRTEDLLRLSLTLRDVEEATAAAHAPVGGGYLADVQGRELPIRPMTRARNEEDLRQTVIGEWRGTPVTLGNVAEVRLGGAPSRGTGSVRGRPATILAVQKNPGVNTLELTDRIDGVLDSFQASLSPGLELYRDVFRQADFIDVAIGNVLAAVRDGTFFVVIILFVFLFNLRTTLITLTAIPLSILTTLLVLRAFGETVNVMTLGGIAVAVGSLVDDAIVDVENVFRRVRENALLPADQRRATLVVVYDASVEVRPAIVLATAMIVLFFIPLFFLTGVEGRFFRPLGLAYVVSLGASLLVAVTMTPVLCYWLLGKGPSLRRERETPVVSFLQRWYSWLLTRVMRRKGSILAGAGALIIMAAGLGSTYGSSFLPDFNEGSVTVFLNAPPGTSLAETDRTAREIELQIESIPGVASVARRTGRGERDEHAEPVSASELDVHLERTADIRDVRRRLGVLLDNAPSLTAQVGGPIAHRLSHILSGTPAAIAIKVFGDDLPTLRVIAKQIESQLQVLPGVEDLVANRELTTVSLPLRFDRVALARLGLTPAEAARQIETAFRGRTVGVVSQGTSRIDIVVRLAQTERRRLDDVKNFLLRSPSGAMVRLGTVATVREESASNLITRENVKRKAVISCNVGEGHNLGDLVAEIRTRVDPIVKQYPGTWVEYGGQFEAQEEASQRILWTSVVALLLVAGMLYMSYRDLRPVLLILLNLPLALVGGVVALFLSDSPSVLSNIGGLFGIGDYVAPAVSIPALVGFIGLAGVACRNGLLLISHTLHIMRSTGLQPEVAVIQGAQERLVPILMTALSSGLALIPLVLAKGAIGNELQYPLALVILGGLVSSTVLNLFVIPAGFAVFGPSSADVRSLPSVSKKTL